MKSTFVTILGFWVGLTLVQAAAPEQKPADQPSKRAEFVKKYDKNGDGKLDKSEWEAARKAHQAELLKKYDTNRNGKIDDAERDAARKEFRKRSPGKTEDQVPDTPKEEAH